jgi:hypothetical protein
MSLLDEQPHPATAEGDVWAEVIGTAHENLVPLYMERRGQGIDRYGVPLQRDNGRDHYADAVQELADAVVYLQAANLSGIRAEVERVLLELLMVRPTDVQRD